VAGAFFSVVAFVQPSLLILITPWKLTELTARIFAGWSLLTFSTVFTIARDGRWSATRILLESAMVAQALTLLALPRMWGDLDLAKPMAMVFLVGLALAFVALASIHLSLDWVSRRSPFEDKRAVELGRSSETAVQPCASVDCGGA
jgi:hypothetical protein